MCEHCHHPAPADAIRVRGARQNNLKNLDVDIALRSFTVVTGVSGSGKSSLAFDTVYAEGQRRYVETFSSYARQFLDRMDKPAVDSIEGIPPAIAIQQTNTVRTSRSTVGTMTEINDRLKLLFAKSAELHCPECGRIVRPEPPDMVADAALDPDGPFLGNRVELVFRVAPQAGGFSAAELRGFLEKQGYRHIRELDDGALEVVQDRLALKREAESEVQSPKSSSRLRARIVEAAEAAYRHGGGRLWLRVSPKSEVQSPKSPSATPTSDFGLGTSDSGLAPCESRAFSAALACPDCGRTFSPSDPNLFSFNSATGACGHCHGFGRVIGISRALVVPDETKSLRDGCIKPFQTETNKFCQDYLVKVARKKKIPVDKPWRDLTDAQREWVWEGDAPPGAGIDDVWDGKVWGGLNGFFRWLESRAYKMHVRVLLSRYREYTECPECHGARLRPEALWWKVDFGEGRVLNIHEFAELPIGEALALARRLGESGRLDEAGTVALREVLSRLEYLVAVGLDYLSLDRQSRTLSGGETQRIALTTALGSNLVNTLFVLDEPSIGLHPRDIGRLNGVLRRLRDAGNTLLVVEHDPDVIRSADRILELGPGPGEKGGEIVYHGSLAEWRESPKSEVRSPKSPAPAGSPKSEVDSSSQSSGLGTSDFGLRTGAQLRIRGASLHNLRDLDVSIPLGRLVVITGVSGSGKSTLLGDVLHPALCRAFGRATDKPSACRALEGVASLADVVLVDQTPIGKTTRSNPSSYVGAFDLIRKVFAKLPAAKEQGYGVGDFSFNSGRGRCPACSGTGYEMVEMQFLSDVYLRCEECGGRRYKGDILDITYDWHGRSLSIADVLELTVDDALDAFASHKDIVRALRPLADVGLGYLRLGQPVPTLSGGETQRLKLAGALAAACGESPRAVASSQLPVASSKSSRTASNGKLRTANCKLQTAKLFLLDEPTTGLHHTDIDVLLAVLRRLVGAGHSVVVIEHNLQFISASDWVIDMGPEGGDAGGRIVAEGTPADVAKGDTHTGRALVRATREFPVSSSQLQVARRTQNYEPQTANCKLQTANSAPPPPSAVVVRDARQNNLQGIDVSLPLGKFNVITGVSGSGKSTLAFDLLFAEGQNRYLECLNAYARQFVQPAAKPDVGSITGLPPTVAIEQRLSRGGQRSTVATVTELHNGLRLFFMKLGTQHCPDCGIPVTSQTPDQILDRVLTDFAGKTVVVMARLVSGRKGIYKELAAWAVKNGIPRLRVDGRWLETAAWPVLDRFREHDIDRPFATERVGPATRKALHRAIHEALKVGKGQLRVAIVGHASAPERDAVFSARLACVKCGRSFEAPDPRAFSFNSRRGWCPECQGYGILGLARKEDAEGGRDEEGRAKGFADVVEDAEPEPAERVECPVCHGARLNPVSLAVRFRGLNIADAARMSVREAREYFDSLRLAGGGHRARHPCRPPFAPRVPFALRPRLPHARPRRPDALRRRGAAHPPRRAARFQPPRRVLHPRRADHRPPRARQRPPPRHPARPP